MADRDRRQTRQKLAHLKESARYENQTGKPFVGIGYRPCCIGQECQTQRKAAKVRDRIR